MLTNKSAHHGIDPSEKSLRAEKNQHYTLGCAGCFWPASRVAVKYAGVNANKSEFLLTLQWCVPH